MGDEKSVTALSAFWTGLLYDAVSLEAAYSSSSSPGRARSASAFGAKCRGWG